MVAPVSASASSNGQDWHLGVLELQRSGYPDQNEDFYFSCVYIESGPITTAIGGPGKLLSYPSPQVFKCNSNSARCIGTE